MLKQGTGTVVAIIVIVAVVIGIIKYNGLVARQETLEKAWAPLEMKLKQRYSPVPRLIADVTAYVGKKPDIAKELESDLEKVSNIKDISDAVDFANQVETDLTQLFQWLRERYPMIISRHSVSMIADTMRETSTTLGPEERAFNKAAEEYNSYARRFPNNVVALVLFFPITYEYYQPKS